MQEKNRLLLFMLLMVTKYGDGFKYYRKDFHTVMNFVTWKIIWENRTTLIHYFLIYVVFHSKQKMKSILLGTSDTYSRIPLFQCNYLISVVTAIICNLPPTIFLLVTCGFLGVSVLFWAFIFYESMKSLCSTALLFVTVLYR